MLKLAQIILKVETNAKLSGTGGKWNLFKNIFKKIRENIKVIQENY